MLAYQVADKMKSQASLEFMAVVVVVLFFLLMLYIPLSARELRTENEETRRKLGSICTDIADKINKAYYFGYGFSQNVSLPDTLYGKNYTVIVNNNRTVVCNTSSEYYIAMFITTHVYNGSYYPPFIIPNKEIIINNSEGVVNIL